MRTITELQKRLNSDTTFEERFNLEADDKVHILYVHPKLNATGYYRMLVPGIELNKTTTHKALFTGIDNYSFSSQFEENINQLNTALIQWADYIIFPTVISDLDYILKVIRELNPQVQLVMDMSKNYFESISDEYLKWKLSDIKLEQLQINLEQMDIVTTPTDSFAHFLQDRLEDTLAINTPSLISRIGYEEMPPINKNTKDAVRIGISISNDENLLFIKEVLIKSKLFFKDKIQFVFIGKPLLSKEGELLLKEVGAEINKRLSFITYFEFLNDLSLDFVLLSAKEHAFNAFQMETLFLEFSAFGIPIITPNTHLANDFVKNEKTGLIVSNNNEWNSAIELLIRDASYRELLGANALKTVWKYHSYSEENIKEFTELFI